MTQDEFQEVINDNKQEEDTFSIGLLHFPDWDKIKRLTGKSKEEWHNEIYR